MGMTMKNRYVGDLQVWWIPQIPMKPFEVDVASVAEGAKILQVLENYDVFQFDNLIKPDCANAGGLRRWCCDADGEGNQGWEDWYDEETGEEDPVAYIAKKGSSA
jgi:hypothetical protein